MKRINIVDRLNERGQKLKDGLIASAQKHGYTLNVTGALALPYFRIAESENLVLHQEWVAECVKRGIFFTNHHNHFINASLTDADIAETIEVADKAFRIIKERNSK